MKRRHPKTATPKTAPTAYPTGVTWLPLDCVAGRRGTSEPLLDEAVALLVWAGPGMPGICAVFAADVVPAILVSELIVVLEEVPGPLTDVALTNVALADVGDWKETVKRDEERVEVLVLSSSSSSSLSSLLLLLLFRVDVAWTGGATTIGFVVGAAVSTDIGAVATVGSGVENKPATPDAIAAKGSKPSPRPLILPSHAMDSELL